MSTESLRQASLKQKLTHEAKELLGIFLFLVVFFEAFGIYRVLLLREFQLEFIRYAAPIVSALVLAKVIMIGEFAGLGKSSEQQRLIISTIYKAFVFGLLAVGFHVVEEAVRAWVHHKGVAEAFEVLHTASGRYELLGQCLVLFCAFIPFFAFRETRRVLGGSRLYDLFFRRRSGAP